MTNHFLKLCNIDKICTVLCYDRYGIEPNPNFAMPIDDQSPHPRGNKHDDKYVTLCST